MPHYIMKIKTEFEVIVTSNSEQDAIEFTHGQFNNIGGDPSIQVWGEVPEEKLDEKIEFFAEEYFNQIQYDCKHSIVENYAVRSRRACSKCGKEM
ncbi:hypothetical protein [Acinetobacter calcoaceticus]|uniref:hypothetical protein n=1 Tax=Acinetobacter calcoaceticus TaxID=471 RepID=UPI0018DE732B|nr:hypothetical protein [Acinetobacter calcoaceticus]